jgi:hypothetical protein
MKELIGKEIDYIKDNIARKVFVAGCDILKGCTLVDKETGEEVYCINKKLEVLKYGFKQYEKSMKFAIESIEKGILNINDDPLEIKINSTNEMRGIGQSCAFK